MKEDIEYVVQHLKSKMDFSTLHNSYGNYAAASAYKEAITLLEVVLDAQRS